MPAPYGVTVTGWSAKTYEEILADLQASARARLGQAIDLNPETSAVGQLLQILSDRLADLWAQGGGLYAALSPDTATGIPLQLLSALTGTFPLPATSTVIAVTLTGTAGTTIPANSVISVPNVSGAKFKNTAAYVIGAGGTVSGVFVATTTGPVPAIAGTVTSIDTPVAGWSSVTNPLDQSYLGTNAESDVELRIRREIGVRGQGVGFNDAIRAAVAKVAGVQDVYVFENAGDITVDTIPPHAFEVVVRGGVDATVAQAIYLNKPEGIALSGSTTVLVNDSQLNSQIIKFTRPTILRAYVSVNIVVDSRAPTNVASLVATAIASYGDTQYRTGSALIAQPLVPPAFAASTGIIDVSMPKIGLAASPTLSDTINPTKRQIIDLDSSRVVVNVTRV